MQVDEEIVAYRAVMLSDDSRDGEWLLTWARSERVIRNCSELPDVYIGDLDARERILGISRGTPVLIPPDGRGDPALCRFFMSPHFARLSLATKRSYAADLRIWLEYLNSRGIEWTDASPDHVNTYWLWRSHSDLNDHSVSGSKVNRELAAISLLYRWASHPSRGHVTFNPVERESLKNSPGSKSKSRKVHSHNVVRERVRWVTPRTYRMWLSLGIEGYLLNETRNSSFRGRNVLRNKAMMEMMFGSGLRITEAASLLQLELPVRSIHGGFHEAHLSAATAKGRAARTWYLLDNALSLVENYVATSRSASVDKARRAGRYDDASWLNVSDTKVTTDAISIKYQGRWRNLDNVEIFDRRRLLIAAENGPEPMWLWLSESGVPLPIGAWTDVMSDANDRVSMVFGEAREDRRLRSNVREPKLSPHSLRHSFALYMLIALHQALDRRDGRTDPSDYNEERYRMAWEMVRDLLGHRHESTTREQYLGPLNGIRLKSLIDQADLQRALSGLARLDSRILDVTPEHHE